MAEDEMCGGRTHRRSLRLPEFDYAQAGAYFVTIVTYQRKCFFGDVVDGEVCLSGIGKIVRSVWDEIPGHFPNVTNNEYVIMPNHVHGIINKHHEGVGVNSMPRPYGNA